MSMTKSAELVNPESCLNKAFEDEPVFVLRAKDPIAAQTIRLWVAMARGVHDDAKRDRARSEADMFDAWRERHATADEDEDEDMDEDVCQHNYVSGCEECAEEERREHGEPETARPANTARARVSVPRRRGK